MRSLLLSASLAALAASATAQCFDQNFGLALGPGGSGFEYPMQPIGFSFPFCGATYTHVHITANGYVHLSNNNVPATPGFSDFTASAAELASGNPRIAMLWNDTVVNAGPQSGVWIKNDPTRCTITWVEVQDWGGNTALYDMQLALESTGEIRMLWGPGASNNSSPGQPTWQAGLTGVSPGMGAIVPSGVDLSTAGASADDTLYEFFALPASFDMASNGLQLIPTNPGWVFLPLGGPTSCASTAEYGTGCPAPAAAHEFFASASSFDIAPGTTITWLRGGAGYTMLTAIPGTIVPPSGGAINIAPGILDGDQTVTLSSAMPVPGGTTSALTITTKGQVQFAPGLIDYTPSVSEFVNWPVTAFHCWHDFDQTWPGGGLIMYEEVGGIAYATWNGVFSYSSGVASTFQWQLDLATGNVTLVFGTMGGLVGNGDAALVGYSLGGPSTSSAETDFSTFLGALSIADVDGIPLRLSASGVPSLGSSTFALVTNDVPPILPAGFLFFGDAQINPGIDLGFLGMPGCNAYSNANLLSVSFPVVAGSGSVVLPIPASPSIIGSLLTAQSVALSAATPAGLSTSNGLLMIVGN